MLFNQLETQFIDKFKLRSYNRFSEDQNVFEVDQMIGRKAEVNELNRLYHTDKAQLVAVYGRRRVGKTYLIDEAFKGRITFRHAGLSPVELGSDGKGALKIQLQNFYFSLQLAGEKNNRCPKSWLEAFFMLEEYLEKNDHGERQVVFLDEMPWMDTPRSGFVTAFEAFWNNWGCHRENLMVIVCGSANSWIRDKLINSHGGLYNRVTHVIKLEPFSLKECREFYEYNNVIMSDYDIARSYMTIGGIPFYMGYMEPGLSFPQNVDKLFFSKGAKLEGEFDRLFDSAFSSPEAMKTIVTALYSRRAGLTRKELISVTGIENGGTLTQYLNALITSDYIISYIPFGSGKREERYKLSDPFCIFWLHFSDRAKSSQSNHFWQENDLSQEVISWSGLAFENLCFNHIDQIKTALGISGISTACSPWIRKENGEKGMQIDLIIDRKDNVVNMCEIKFYSSEFSVDKNYHMILMDRCNAMIEMLPKKKTVHSTLITTYGLKPNAYSGDFTNVITLEDLVR